MVYFRMLLLQVVIIAISFNVSAETYRKSSSVLFTADMVSRARENIGKYDWAASIAESAVDRAAPWLEFTDDELWDLMFGNTIRRSWMVWSDGHCPSCGNSVPMYTWKIDAINRPWKVRCPHCGELFPKNDFHAYYQSGLDKKGVFDPDIADGTLLYNEEHSGSDDPLRKFGVDDGEGYVDGDKRWRFIGTYLVYGQWKQVVVAGIRNCAEAYVVTGDPRYAHISGVLLDRVADLYGTFDFGEQGIVYERKADDGYVSTWHDACEEHHRMVLAYDQVFEALKIDRELVAFLGKKAREHNLSNRKASFEDIQRNIEDGILRNAIEHSNRIRSNYPSREIALALTHTVLGWPANRDTVLVMIDDMIKDATKVDGLTGEKGLGGYSAFPINTMAGFIEMFNRIDPAFLEEMIRRHPNLAKTWRFHLDMWFEGEYLPQIGDSGSYARKFKAFPTARTTSNPGLRSSMFSFLWNLYEALDDPIYVQLLYDRNGKKLDNLPIDLFSADPEAFRENVRKVIKKHGGEMAIESVNMEEWCLAMMRSGSDAHPRAFWIDYDSGGPHGHVDGMNIGLFAKGLDLLPEFGYPPVQYGGWGAPRARWVVKTAAHNTVVVDRKDQKFSYPRFKGSTFLWGDGEGIQVIGVSAPNVYDIDRYDRTVAMIDMSDEDFYLLDIFNVTGGRDHTKFLHSHFGEVTTGGLSLSPAEEYAEGVLMRDFRRDPAPQTGWYVDWDVSNKLGYLESDSDLHVRHTDLTTGAEAYLAEAWITTGSYNDIEEVWIPRVMTRRIGDADELESTFVGILEQYEGSPSITDIHRHTPMIGGEEAPDHTVALELRFASGNIDIVMYAGAKPGGGDLPVMTLDEPSLSFNGRLCFMRMKADGTLLGVTFHGGDTLTFGDLEIRAESADELIELSFRNGYPEVLSDNVGLLRSIRYQGRELGM